jgi:hypothetical protein
VIGEPSDLREADSVAVEVDDRREVIGVAGDRSRMAPVVTVVR